MSNKKTIIISDTINDFVKIKNEIPGSKAKRKFEKTLVEIKRLYDKFYYNAYYDYRFECSNYNKLLEDLKIMDERKGFKLLFIRVPGLTRSFYLKNSLYSEITFLIEEMKNYINSNADKFMFKSVYVVDNYIICLPRTKHVLEVYNNFKAKKEKIGKDLGIVYVPYQKFSSKINKNLNACIAEAIRITKEIPTKEKIVVKKKGE